MLERINRTLWHRALRADRENRPQRLTCPRGDSCRLSGQFPPVEALPAASAPRSASISRHRATFSLCSASVSAKA